jgi:hypothetical protein
MSGSLEVTAHRSVRLPNGLTVYGLSEDDTLMVYRDIFEDDCYRRHGVTIGDGDCILNVGANTGLFILYLNSIIINSFIYAFEPVPAIFRVLRRNVEAHNKLAIQLFNVGLSRQSRQATFTYYPRLSNASTMYPDDSARAVQRGRSYVLERFRELPWPLPFLLSLCPALLKNALTEQVRKYGSSVFKCETTGFSSGIHQEYPARNGCCLDRLGTFSLCEPFDWKAVFDHSRT